MLARDQILWLLLSELREATVCCEIKLNAKPTDWGELLNNFDADPEQTLLRIAAQLREHISHL